ISLPTSDATVVVCTESAMSKDFIAHATRPLVTYGVHDGNFTAGNILWGEKTSFDIMHHDSVLAQVEMSLLGEHNIQNIVGVAAFLFSRNLVTPEQFVKAVDTFRGIVRRLDRKSEKTTIPIFEGFGTSYEKAKSAVAAMKQHFPTRRIVIVFEPHTFSWRNRDALHWYDTVFEGATKVFVYEPASQGASTHAQSTQEEIVSRINNSGTNAIAIINEQQTLNMLDAELTENDCVLLLTSGDLGGLIESIPKLAERMFPK
ncbi:MAG: Mur ligase family protein, partial [bacterium]|nr:Mur ligase family protein [bacterium]